MYVCKDCKKQYKEKIEYCDCGNNTFDYIEEKVKSTKTPLTLEQKSEIISKIFLFVCIILSAIVWLIPVKTELAAEEKIIQKIDEKIIPDIDKIWDSTPVKKPEIKETEIEQKNILDTIREPLPEDKVQKKEIQKPAQKPVQKSVQPTNKIQQKPKSEIPKQVTQNPAPKRNTNQQATKPKEQVKKAETTPKEPEKPKYNPNSPEMLKYKGSLRAAMFAKLAIGSVRGAGTCSVHFSIDNSGKLINRSFTKYSDNKSLNDAVYYMMMSVPRFASPPEEYNGEFITMTFKIDSDGSYEISIY